MKRVSTRYRPAILAAPLAATLLPNSLMAQATPEGSPMASPVASTVTYPQIVDGMWNTLQQYYATDHGMYKPRYPEDPNENPYSYLWPYSAVVSAANARAAALNTPEADADLVKVLTALRAYEHTPDAPEGYDSYIVAQGGGDRYYDDNMWLGIDFVYAARHLNDPQWLEKSVQIWEFLQNGWSDDMGGGFYWRENDFATKNTCSNGPAAVMALLLHEDTGDEQYLEFAKKIMTWLDDTLLDPESGVYNDNLREDGTVEGTKWSYNAGTPLHAKALLYKATGDEQYLTEARALAAASAAEFAPQALDAPVRLFPNTPWFNSILHRGFVALHEVDPDKDPQYISMLPELLKYGWDHARDQETGILAMDWSWTDMPGAEEVLQQAPAIEVAASATQLGLK